MSFLSTDNPPPPEVRSACCFSAEVTEEELGEEMWKISRKRQQMLKVRSKNIRANMSEGSSEIQRASIKVLF